MWFVCEAIFHVIVSYQLHALISSAVQLYTSNVSVKHLPLIFTHFWSCWVKMQMITQAVAFIFPPTCQRQKDNSINFGTEILGLAAPRSWPERKALPRPKKASVGDLNRKRNCTYLVIHTVFLDCIGCKKKTLTELEKTQHAFFGFQSYLGHTQFNSATPLERVVFPVIMW